MKKNLFVFVAFAFLSLFLLSCGKNEPGCQPVSPSAEKSKMVAYCSANGINYTEHSSGILYEIIIPGSGNTPTINNTISVVYTGKLLNDYTFDSRANPISFSLGGVIDGWKIGIPLIQKGGRIKLVIPSALAYSCSGSAQIPPNSPLFFDVTLTDVK